MAAADGKVLITGGAGGVGAYVARLFAGNGLNIRVFDLPTDTNKKVFKPDENGIETCWGDINDRAAVSEAMKGVSDVFHLAALVPPATEKNRELARRVNIEGTRTVAECARAESESSGRRIILRFSSSVAIYGRTDHLEPPVTVSHPLNPGDTYSETKVAAEEIVRNSGLPWTIFRFGAAAYLSMRKGSFEQMRIFLPEQRIEFVHIKDVAQALLNSIGNEEAIGKTFILGGGPKCQLLYKDQIKKAFDMMGFPEPNWSKFSKEPYYLDWYDTAESQRILKFQSRTYDDYLNDFRKTLGIRYYMFRYVAGPLMKLFQIHV